jgi:hypothetical protein
MDDDDRCEWRGRSNAHVGGDGREWRRWSALVATVWIQAVTGTNFDFSAYSSALKSSLGVSQQSLNYLATASDLGKAFGWSSGLALLYMPLPAVLLLSAALGLAAYVVQYCVLLSSSPSRPAIPYPVVSVLFLLKQIISIKHFNQPPTVSVVRTCSFIHHSCVCIASSYHLWTERNCDCTR